MTGCGWVIQVGIILGLIAGVAALIRFNYVRPRAKTRARQILKAQKIEDMREVDQLIGHLDVETGDPEAKHLAQKLLELKDKALGP